MSFIINPYSFGVALHPRLVAWLARGTALGYTLPSAAQQVKLNTFFYALETAGIITGVTSSLLDVFYIFAIDGSSDMATINVITPASFQATKVNSPTFTSNVGFNGNGTTSYLSSNWIPSSNGVNYTLNNAGMGIYSHTDVNDASREFGALNGAGTNAVDLRIRSSNLLTGTVNDFTSPSVASASSVGFYHTKRTASNARSIYKNGSLISSPTNASVGLPDRAVFIGALNNGAGSPIGPSVRQYGMFFAGASLNGLESAFYTAWNNYFTSL